jgi:cellulose synthase/poly-beta-1,6-N-acetylglucosamine synthase-like glycosyltransferase
MDLPKDIILKLYKSMARIYFMKNLPRVTVIIPCRNEELWIGKCIESVLKTVIRKIYWSSSFLMV